MNKDSDSSQSRLEPATSQHNADILNKINFTLMDLFESYL